MKKSSRTQRITNILTSRILIALMIVGEAEGIWSIYSHGTLANQIIAGTMLTIQLIYTVLLFTRTHKNEATSKSDGETANSKN